ncbi:hypothetical protein [Streptomyces sp. NPDC002082]|uniref:hypothetical protein n=1 Tax=Streptomyces sp. NPDC002082 TaxID=3154772 RepID=UPI00332CE379
MRKYLVDAPPEHHVADEAQCDQITLHASRLEPCHRGCHGSLDVATEGRGFEVEHTEVRTCQPLRAVTDAFGPDTEQRLTALRVPEEGIRLEVGAVAGTTAVWFAAQCRRLPVESMW